MNINRECVNGIEQYHVMANVKFQMLKVDSNLKMSYNQFGDVVLTYILTVYHF